MHLAAWNLKFENEPAFKSFSKEKVTYINRINPVFKTAFHRRAFLINTACSALERRDFTHFKQ